MKEEDILKLFRKGDLMAVDVSVWKNAYKGKESKLAEHFQFAMYQFCNKQPPKVHIAKTLQLLGICYSPLSLPHLKNMQRFTCSIAAIFSCLKDWDQCSEASKLQATLQLKETELKEAAKTSLDTRKALFVIHYHFLNSAKSQRQNEQLFMQLLESSLFVMELISVKDDGLMKKFIANMQNIITTTNAELGKALTTIIERSEGIAKTLSGKDEPPIVFRDFLLLNACSTFKLGLQNHYFENWMAMGNPEEAALLKKYCSSFERDVEDCLTAAKMLISCADNETWKRYVMLIAAMYQPDMYTGGKEQQLTPSSLSRHHRILEFLMNSSSSFREFALADRSVGNPGSSLLQYLVGACASVCQFSRQLVKGKVKEKENLKEVLGISAEAFSWGRRGVDEIRAASSDPLWPSNCWMQLVARVANTIEDLLMICQKTSNFEHLKEYCGTVLSEITSSDELPKIDDYRFWLLFDRWGMANMVLKQYDKAMFAYALHIVANTKPSAQLYDSALAWATAKFSSKETRATLQKYIYDKKKQLKEWRPQLNLEIIDWKEVRLAEACAYRAIGTSDAWEAMIGLWRTNFESGFADLKSLPSSRVMEAAFLLSSMMLTFSPKCDDSISSTVQSRCQQLLKRTSSAFKSDAKGKAHEVYCETILHLALFICNTSPPPDSEWTAESRAEVVKQLQAEAVEKAKFGEDVDMNVTCDVAVKSSDVSLHEEARRIKLLDQSLGYLARLPSSWQDGALTVQETWLALEYMQLMINTAISYGAVQSTAKACVIFYKFAKVSNIWQARLFALAAILQCCQLSSSSPLFAEAKECVSNEIAKLTDGNTKKLPQEVLDPILTCQLAIADVCLNSGLYKEAYEVIKFCGTYVEKMRSKNRYYLLNSQYLCAQSKLWSAAPEFGDARKGVLRASQDAFSCAHAGFEAVSSMENLVNLLKISTWCAELKLCFLWTPWVRIYLENLYLSCQCLGLTCRTAQLLAILLRANIACGQIDDARRKLASLADLLYLPTLSDKEDLGDLPTTFSTSPTCLPASPLRCRLGSTPVTIFHNRLRKPGTLSGPETFVVNSNSMLVELVTVVARICEAGLAVLLGKNTLADLYYKHCTEALESFDGRKYETDILSELAAVSQGESVLLVQRNLDSVTARLKLDYASFTMILNCQTSTPSTESLLKESAGCISKLTFEQFLFDWQLMELQVCAIVMRKQLEKPKTEPATLLEPKRLNFADPAAAKTPRVNRLQVPDKAPKKFQLSCEPQTPAARPVKGRRILGSSSSVKASTSKVSKKVSLMAPESSKLQVPNKSPETKLEIPAHLSPESSAFQIPKKATLVSPQTPAVSRKVYVTKSSARRRRPRVVRSSDSDSEVPGTPETKSTKKLVDPLKKAVKPIPIIFDESKDPEPADKSADVFEAFEKMKISEPDVRRSTRKPTKAEGSKGKAKETPKASASKIALGKRMR